LTEIESFKERLKIRKLNAEAQQAVDEEMTIEDPRTDLA
jgi:hypothetical protein